MNPRKFNRTFATVVATLMTVVGTTAALGLPTAYGDPEAPAPLSEPVATPTATEQTQAAVVPNVSEATPPFGANFPVLLEANFSRPHYDKGTTNYDYSLLDDLERLIRGSYMTPQGAVKPKVQREAPAAYVSVSRMEESVRVGREMIRAAQHGVTVKFIHGKATQSGASRSLVKNLNAQKTGHVLICSKGKSLACLSGLNGAITHAKIVMVSRTDTRAGDPGGGAIWTGS